MSTMLKDACQARYSVLLVIGVTPFLFVQQSVRFHVDVERDE